MSNPQNPSILATLRLAKAMGLARKGQWREAENAVTDGNPNPTDPTELHALAALVTSEGDYLRALRLWEQLQQSDPSNEEARRMVPAIELWLSRPSWAPYFPYIASGLAAAVVALFLYIALAGPSYTPPHHASMAVAPVSSPAANPISPTDSVSTPTPAPLVAFPVAAPAGAKPAKKHVH